MNALFGTQYFGFIASAYGVTLVALVLLTLSIVVTHHQRKRKLAELEKSGLRRASPSNG